MRLPFFNRSSHPAPAAAPAASDDTAVQAARTAARRRLVGALVLLLIGVVGFPLLFETQPRPLPANTPIYLPEGTPARVASPAVAPTPAPTPAPVPAPPRTAMVVPPDAGTEAVLMAASAASVASPKATAPVASAAAPRPQPAPAPPPVAVAPKPAPAAAASTPEPSTGRFVVQVGAYNDSERMKAARQKVEKLGFKSYTQDVTTADGKRTRVRAGPFGTRKEAEQAAGKLKAAGLQADVLSL